MAATRLEIIGFPKHAIAGVLHQFRVTAKNADGTTDAGFTGTVTFTSSDAGAALPADYAFGGGDAGTKLFKAKLNTVGNQSLIVSSGVLSAGTAYSNVTLRPPGWGIDDFGLDPYGDAAAAIGSSIKAARAVTTRQVSVDVTNFVKDDSPYLDGDALNPNTWVLQRLDTAEFFTVVAIEQTGTFQYTILTLEEFGPVSVTHRVSSSTLQDLSGNVINTPRSADFLGLLDASTAAGGTPASVKSTDIANPQIPTAATFLAGTLQIDASGDYRTESGAELVKKLIMRRVVSKPGDFFHLPEYGFGLRLKEPIRSAELGKLKSGLELQAKLEPEVESARVTASLDNNGILRVNIKAVLRKTGEVVDVGFKTNNQGLVL